MQIKAFVLSFCALAMLATAAQAQDKIYKRDGDIIEAKISNVGTKSITYQRFSNLTGPEYTMDKSEIQKIVYQNGNQEEFEQVFYAANHHHSRRRPADMGRALASPKIPCKPNVLAIAPLQFSENGLGVSLSYERAIDKNKLVSFYLPLIATWNLNSGTYVNSQGNTQNGNEDLMLYAMPGVKFYPMGSDGQVRYAVGPSLVIGSGQKSSGNYDYYSTTYTYVTQSHFILGVMISNSLNINPSPHIYLGLELGLGLTYLNRLAGLNQDTEFLAQGSFKVGYRF